MQETVFRLRASTFVALVVLSFVWFPNPTCADTFRIIDADQEAAQVRVDMIQQAREEILIELYRASEDRMVLSYLALLRDAARRGVKVRFLIDGYFNEISKPVLAHLIQEGVAIKEYHPLRITKLGWFNRRLHDKLILVDGREMLIGGRNLENPWFGVTEKSYVERAYVDRDVYVAGKVVEATSRYFMRLWNSQEVSDAALGPHDPEFLPQQCDESRNGHSYERCEQSQIRAAKALQEAAALLDWHRADLSQNTLVHLNPATDWSAGQRDVTDIRFFHDPVGRKGKDPGTFDAFLRYVDSAKSSIIIESPYLVLSKSAKAAFMRAIDRGVQVRVLTNSLASTQNFFAQGGYEGKKADLVRLGLEIWEYKGPKMLHAKSVVIDNTIAIIGNFNIDPRSQFLNTELAVAAHDEVLARQLRVSMDMHLANAWLIGPDGKAIGEDSRFPRAKSGRIVKLRFYQLFALLFKNQL
ncbi:MAG: phosphatidylserine/phosphatidylglycerophosphate/cardiolipin synthase family protein [Acidiferrobacterales bacterium]